jgi:nicotinamidase-related amidase
MPTVSAQPYKYSFEPASTALVMIDMQRDFIEPGGFGDSLGNNVALLAAIVPTVRRLLDGCRAAGVTIIHTKEAHRPDLADLHVSKHKRGDPRLKIGDAGRDGTPAGRRRARQRLRAGSGAGAGRCGHRQAGQGCVLCDRSVRGTLRLRGITHLLIGGVTTEVCVQTTMREANDRGYECLLVEDATESYFPQFKASVLDMVRAQGGIVGWTGTSAAILRSLKQA